MPLDLSILYRGTLSSCNYDCSYCPFAKHRESSAELRKDRAELTKFCDWVGSRTSDRIAVFFTPWGEALVREWYRAALIALSRLPNVRKVAVQTNLSCNLDWLSRAAIEKLGLWCTYHPSETSRESFLRQCERLESLGVRYSVGCVGLQEYISEIDELRKELPAGAYLWINAYKSQPDYYSETMIEELTRIDPHFLFNNTYHNSLGQSCRCGTSVIAVDGAGDIRRCHFVDEVVGNIYEPGFEHALVESPCPNRTCGCHIGYVHLDKLRLYPLYGDGVLERIPVTLGAGT